MGFRMEKFGAEGMEVKLFLLAVLQSVCCPLEGTGIGLPWLCTGVQGAGGALAVSSAH